MNEIRVTSGIEVKVNDNGDTIAINADNQCFVENFYGLYERLENLVKEIDTDAVKAKGDREKLQFMIERTKEIIAMVPDGGNYKNLPIELHNTRKVHIAWTRLNSTRPSMTIDTGHFHHFHYEYNRVPTARESARIQSFPDTFVFLGNKTSKLKQIGNAVPPLMAKAIAEQIGKQIK